MYTCLYPGNYKNIICASIQATKTKMTFVFPRMAKDPRFERLPCMHKGTYADNCIVNRIQQVRLLIPYLF